MCSICLTAPSFLHCFIKLFLYQQILWHLFPCQVIFAPTAGSNYGSFSMNFHSIRNVEVRFFLYVYIQRYFIYVFIYSFLCILYLLLPSVKHFVSKNIAKEEFRLYLNQGIELRRFWFVFVFYLHYQSIKSYQDEFQIPWLWRNDVINMSRAWVLCTVGISNVEIAMLVILIVINKFIYPWLFFELFLSQ